MDKKLMFAMAGWATAGLMTIAYMGRGKQLEEMQTAANDAFVAIQLADKIVTNEIFKSIVDDF